MVVIDILHLVDRLEEIVTQSRAIPLSARVVLDEDRFLDIVDQMRVSIPEEIKKARRIQQERERIIAQANEEAGRIVSLAQDEANKALTDHEVVRAAESRAAVIVERAQKEAQQIRADADQYVLEVLGQLEYQLDGLLTTVRNGLRRLEHSRQRAVMEEQDQGKVAQEYSME